MRRRRLLVGVVRQLVAQGCLVTTQIAEDLATDKRLAAEAATSGDVDAVVAAGGDSTVRGAAAGLLGSDLPLGVIPVGTGNVMAAELGLKRKPAWLAQYLMHAPIGTVSGGTANGEPFFLMAGIGFDASVVGRLDNAFKQRVGKVAYTWPVLRTLSQPLPRLEVEIDGTAHSASWVIVTKVQRYGGAFVLSPRSALDKPGLTTVLVRARTRAGLVAQLLRVARGKLEDSPEVEFVDGAQTIVRSQTPVPAQIDGESFGTTPVTIAPESRTLKLLMPNGSNGA